MISSNKIFYIILILCILCGVGCVYTGGFLEATSWLPSFVPIRRISTFGIFLALTFLVCNFILTLQFKRVNIPTQMADTIIILAIVGGIMGSKVFFAIEIWDSWYGFDGFLKTVFSGAGLTWYGGFILATIFILLYVKRKNYSVAYMFDLIAPALAIGYAVGRLACWASGDGCYGIKCDLNWLPAPFAMSFPNGAENWARIAAQFNTSPDVLRVFNTPLFESLFSLVLFIILWKLRFKEWSPGTKLAFYTIFHSLFRFMIEYIRLNPKDVFGMSQAQFVSIILLLVSISYIIYVYYIPKYTDNLKKV